MNIQFTINVHSFEKAAAVEKALKGLDFNYSTRVDDKPSLGAGKRSTRVVIGKDELAAVLQCIASHPGWTHNAISKSTGVSRATVGRISTGKHVLQSNGADNESNIHEG